MNACHELSPLPKETSVNPRLASLDQDTLNNQGFTSLEQDPEDILSNFEISFGNLDTHVMSLMNIFVAANGQHNQVPSDSEHLVKNMKVLTPRKSRSSSGVTSEMRPSDDVVIAMGEVRHQQNGSR